MGMLVNTTMIEVGAGPVKPASHWQPRAGTGHTDKNLLYSVKHRIQMRCRDVSNRTIAAA